MRSLLIFPLLLLSTTTLAATPEPAGKSTATSAPSVEPTPPAVKAPIEPLHFKLPNGVETTPEQVYRGLLEQQEQIAALQQELAEWQRRCGKLIDLLAAKEAAATVKP